MLRKSLEGGGRPQKKTWKAKGKCMEIICLENKMSLDSILQVNLMKELNVRTRHNQYEFLLELLT